MRLAIRIRELHGRVDERIPAQRARALGEGGKQLKQPRPGRQVGAGEHRLRWERRITGKAAQVGGDEFVLAGEVLVERPLGDVGGGAQLRDAGGVDAVSVKQVTGGGEDPLPGTAAPRGVRRRLTARARRGRGLIRVRGRFPRRQES